MTVIIFILNKTYEFLNLKSLWENKLFLTKSYLIRFKKSINTDCNYDKYETDRLYLV